MFIVQVWLGEILKHFKLHSIYPYLSISIASNSYKKTFNGGGSLSAHYHHGEHTSRHVVGEVVESCTSFKQLEIVHGIQ